MNKLFTSIATMIITHFIMKAVDKITSTNDTSELNREVERKRQLKREVDRERQEWERSKRDARIHPRFESTPRSPDAWLSQIGSIPKPKEPCDGAALRACGDMATASNFEPAMGVNR